MRMLQRQRGVAVVTALLLTTLAISIVASLFWQQQVQVRTMENQRLHLQTKWILRGALDWATLVLRQDGYDNSQYTALTHVWATPLAETRLDQFIDRERVAGEDFEATLSGNIIDACSRYNLTNLAQDRQVNPAQVKVFQRLLQNLRLDPELAERTARMVAAAQPQPLNPDNTAPAPATRSTASTTMKLVEVDDLLAVQGFNQAAIEKLRPFVIVLPEPTAVNVNTAPAEVLAAVLPKMSLSEANTLLVRRKQAPWKDFGQFKTEAAHGDDLDESIASVKSQWFLVDSRIRLDRAALNAESLVYRPLASLNAAISGTSVKWTREY